MESAERRPAWAQFEWYRGLKNSARLKEAIFEAGFIFCPEAKILER